MAEVITAGRAAASKVVVTFLALLAAVLASAEENTRVDFFRDVQPILKAACFNCHGPEKQSGRLRLDATLWSRPPWLVDNHKTIGVKIENGHLAKTTHARQTPKTLDAR